MRRIAIIQHQADEDEGFIKDWFNLNNYSSEHWYVWQDREFEDASHFDGIIVLGGEMDVKDRQKLPWMLREIEWLSNAIKNKVPCFGICLGSQLIAHILGAKIHPLEYPEKGVLPLSLETLGVLEDLPFRQLQVNQAHSFRFDIPDNCTNYASSELCQQQLFISSDQKILGIQCHLEWSEKMIRTVLNDKVSEKALVGLDEGKTKLMLFNLLDKLFSC